jgi:hypothetical protein
MARRIYVGLSDESVYLWQHSTALHAVVFKLSQRFGSSFESLCDLCQQLSIVEADSVDRIARRDLLEPVALGSTTVNSGVDECFGYSEFVACVALAVERRCLMKENLSPQEFFGINMSPESFEMKLRRCEKFICHSIFSLIPSGLSPSDEVIRECAVLQTFSVDEGISFRIAPDPTLKVSDLSFFGGEVKSQADVCLVAKMHKLMFSSLAVVPPVSSPQFRRRVKTFEVRQGPIERICLNPFDSRGGTSHVLSPEERHRARYQHRFREAISISRMNLEKSADESRVGNREPSP